MRAWNFKVKSNPEAIGDKLESSLGSYDGLVFNMDSDKNNSVTFKVRKRILYAWYMIYHNWTIVHGKLLKTDTENNTNVEVSFTQHFLIKLIIYTHMFLGLCLLIAIFSGTSRSAFMFILGALLLVVGIVSWFAIEKKFEKDILKYKSLISGVLES